MNHLICYADANMRTSQRLCAKSALMKGSINTVSVFNENDFDSGFYQQNMYLLESVQRGGGKGFWLFKPYFCYRELMRLKSGYLIYADSGIEFISSIDPIIQMMDRDIFLFGNGHAHLHWCKMETIKAMLWASDPDRTAKMMDFLEYQEQAQASVIIFRVNDFTRQFCKDWLEYCLQPGFIDDSPGNIPNHPEYKAHRNDQSILTNLSILHAIPLHWWPVQYGHYIRHKYAESDNYGQLFYHHRYRESDWLNCGLSIDQFMNQPKI